MGKKGKIQAKYVISGYGFNAAISFSEQMEKHSPRTKQNYLRRFFWLGSRVSAIIEAIEDL